MDLVRLVVVGRGRADCRGLVLVRLPWAWFPPDWRRWASNWAVAGLAVFVTAWLSTLAPAEATELAAGLAILTGAAQLCRVLPPSVT